MEKEYEFWFGLIQTLSICFPAGIYCYNFFYYNKYQNKQTYELNKNLLRNLVNRDCTKFDIIYSLLKYNKKTRDYYISERDNIKISLISQNLNENSNMESLDKKLKPISWF